VKRKSHKGRTAGTAGHERRGSSFEKEMAKLLQRHQNDPTVEAAVDLAAFYYTHGLESRILETLEPLRNRQDVLENSGASRFLALLSLGYAHADRLIDAESSAQKLADCDPLSCDVWYVLCFVHLSMREYDRAIEAATRYLDSRASETSNGASARSFCTSGAHRSQLCNMLASAFRETGRLDEAERMYGEAIKVDSGNHLPYLNLADLLKKLGRQDESNDVVSRGLRSARQIQELRMLGAAKPSQSTISACMIVKDEEELLPDCLASIRDWVDEIILVDTGSTDRTVEIARSYGAKVFHHAWEGDFSRARNQSLSYATQGWIFIIDADERVTADDVPQLRRVLDDEQAQMVSINVYNVYGDSVSAVTFLPSIRLFRRSLGLRYEGTVHNALVYPDSLPVVRVGARLKHLGYGLSKGKMAQKLARSRVLLEQQLRDNPDNAFALFNYAQLLRGETSTFPTQNAELILKSAQRAVELTRPDISSERHIHLMCLDQMAWTCFHQGRYAEASEYARRALGYKPNYLDPLLLLGHVAARQEAWDEARTRYEDYLSAQAAYDPSQETDNIILLHIDSRPSAWYSLGMMAEIQGDPDRAQRYFESIIERDPAYLETNAHLGRLALQRHDLSTAEDWYRRHVKAHPESLDGYRRLGQLLLTRQQLLPAAEIFRQALSIDAEDIACLIGLGRAESEMGLHTEAAESFRRALEADPMNKVVLRELADVHFTCGRYGEAANIYQRLAGVEPPGADLLNDLGNCYFKMEQYEAAEKAYREAITKPDHDSSVWRNLGLSLLRHDDQEGALEALTRYIGYHPEELAITNILADLCFSHGRYSDALDFLEQYLTAKPDDISSLFMLSECYLHMGHQESAIIGYRRILKLAPDFQSAQKRLAELTSTPAAMV
jgi:tetratricopeptide (TPR) repeat protein